MGNIDGAEWTNAPAHEKSQYQNRVSSRKKNRIFRGRVAASTHRRFFVHAMSSIVVSQSFIILCYFSNILLHDLVIVSSPPLSLRFFLGSSSSRGPSHAHFIFIQNQMKCQLLGILCWWYFLFISRIYFSFCTFYSYMCRRAKGKICVWVVYVREALVLDAWSLYAVARLSAQNTQIWRSFNKLSKIIQISVRCYSRSLCSTFSRCGRKHTVWKHFLINSKTKRFLPSPNDAVTFRAFIFCVRQIAIIWQQVKCRARERLKTELDNSKGEL